MNEIIAAIVSGLILGLVIALIILVQSLASDVETIKDDIDLVKHCDGQVLFNDQFQIWECKEIVE